MHLPVSVLVTVSQLRTCRSFRHPLNQASWPRTAPLILRTSYVCGGRRERFYASRKTSRHAHVQLNFVLHMSSSFMAIVSFVVQDVLFNVIPDLIHAYPPASSESEISGFVLCNCEAGCSSSRRRLWRRARPRTAADGHLSRSARVLPSQTRLRGVTHRSLGQCQKLVRC